MTGMAWNSTKDAALNVIGLHMGVMKPERKQELSDFYAQNIFGPDRERIQWDRRWGIVFVNLRGKNTLMKNIRFFMIQEQMNQGPPKYCVLGHNLAGYENRLLFLMNFLPHRKICTYPIRLTLRGPFELPQWRDRGREVSLRGINLKEFDAPGTWKTSPSGDMVCIRMTDLPHLLDNIRFALFKETMGLGPVRYCIVYQRTRAFYSHLGMVTTFLPRHKMFMYPGNDVSNQLFGREPWLSRARAICAQPSITPGQFRANFIDPRA